MTLFAAHRAGETLARIHSLTKAGLREPGSINELAGLYFSIDRYEDALGVIETARAEGGAVAAGPASEILEAWCRFHLGELNAATQILERLLARPDASDAGFLGRVETLRSWVLLEQGALSDAVIAAETALSRLRGTAEHRAYGDALLAIGRIHLRAGRVEDALETFRDALGMFRRDENLSGMGRALHDMALAEKSLGRLTNAEAGYRAALEIAEQLGQRRFLMTRRHNLAIVLFHRGLWRASLRLAEAALQDAIGIGDAFVEACARITCARALAVRGDDPDRALSLLERALAIAGGRGFQREEALASEFLGDLARGRGDWATAETWWRRALAIGERVAPRGDVTGEPLRRLSEARLAADDVAGALEFGRRAYDVARGCKDRREQLVMLRVFGKIAAARGRDRAAWGAFQVGIRDLEAIGARGELAESLVALGEHLACSESDSDRVMAVETFERAIALFDDADLPARAKSAQGLLGQFGGIGRGAGERAAAGAASPGTRATRRGARMPSPVRRLSVKGARGQRDLLTRDTACAALFDRLTSVARESGAILLLGETGTGKELLARLVHEASGRRGRFIATNAAAFPEGLVESELFGHLRGAFTGAVEDKVGLIEAADGGTFFLDEVGDLPPAIQVKLLRILDETVVRRVGAIEGRAVDVRFVAATNQDVRRLVREGIFRRDLFYRLSVHEFDIPPLRERRGDVALLSHSSLARLAARDRVEPPAISPEALAALEAYGWPGNIRELESEMERAYSRARDARDVKIGHLSPWVASRAETSEDLRLLRGEVAAFERMRIREALSRFNGNMARAAESLGMTRQALRYKIQKYDLANDRIRPTGKARD